MSEEEDEYFGPDEEPDEEPDYSMLAYCSDAANSAAEEAEEEDRYEYNTTGASQRRNGEMIPFHNDFPAAFIAAIGGHPSNPRAVPFMALLEWLENHFARYTERPHYQYMADLLIDAFPDNRGRRVEMAIKWLEAKRDACPSWPPVYRTEGVNGDPLCLRLVRVSDEQTETLPVAPVHGPRAVEVLCMGGFSVEAAAALFQHLGVIDASRKDIAHRAKGQASRIKSAYTAGYLALRNAGLFAPTENTRVWADILKRAYHVDLSEKVRSYNEQPDSGSQAFRRYLKLAKEWAAEWKANNP